MNRSWIGLAVVLTMSPCAFAGAATTSSQTIPKDDADTVLVKIDFGMGEFELGRAREGTLMEGTFRCDPEEMKARVDYHRRGDKGVLDLSAEYDSNGFPDHVKNEWLVGLAGDVPLDLELDLGAAEARIDLSGLSVTQLNLEVGAADCEVWWDHPNLVPLSEIQVDCGASSFSMAGLGYAGFERMRFEGGLGSFELDFTGDWLRSAEADIEIGLGSMKLLVPRNIGVRIEAEKAMASVEVDRRFVRRGDDVYESENYESATVRLLCRVELGMGTLVVKSLPAGSR